AADFYRDRYPESASQIAVIENGYDEGAFVEATSRLSPEPLNRGALTFVHSGVVYPEWRNPEHLLTALRRLIGAGRIRPDALKLRFRAPVHDAFVRDLAARCGVASSIEVLPPIGYVDALAEMMRADGLFVLQSCDCNQQVPAKLYEYFRARRPV